MKAKKKIGPKTVPCGTSDLTAASADEIPSTTTHWDRLVRKFLIQFRMLPLTP